MVRQMKTYTIVDPELRSLWIGAIAAGILLFFGALALGLAVTCSLSATAIQSATGAERLRVLLHYGPVFGFVVSAIFLILALLAWLFAYSSISRIRQGSRDGRVIIG